MSDWNYRILRQEVHFQGTIEHVFEVIEAYYNDEGVIDGWCTADAEADTAEDLKKSLGLMLAAFDEPILERSDLPMSNSQRP